jgi:hypothetical protein
MKHVGCSVGSRVIGNAICHKLDFHRAPNSNQLGEKSTCDTVHKLCTLRPHPHCAFTECLFLTPCATVRERNSRKLRLHVISLKLRNEHFGKQFLLAPVSYSRYKFYRVSIFFNLIRAIYKILFFFAPRTVLCLIRLISFKVCLLE